MNDRSYSSLLGRTSGCDTQINRHKLLAITILTFATNPGLDATGMLSSYIYTFCIHKHKAMLIPFTDFAWIKVCVFMDNVKVDLLVLKVIRCSVGVVLHITYTRIVILVFYIVKTMKTNYAQPQLMLQHRQPGSMGNSLCKNNDNSGYSVCVWVHSCFSFLPVVQSHVYTS